MLTTIDTATESQAATRDLPWLGRTVLVTGASRGIGEIVSRMWLERGATVIAHSSREVGDDPRLRHLGDDITTGRLRRFTADASIPGHMGAAFRELLESETEIDAVFFNHGTTTFAEDGETIIVAPPSTYDPEQMRHLVQVNALSIWEALYEICQHWARDEAREENARRKRGIVLESSSGALNPNVFDPLPYKTSKAMLLRYVRDLAPELARYRVSINAVSPGMIDAGLSHLPCVEAMRESIMEGIPMKRYGEPAELFEAVDLFLSGRAPFSTGNNLTLNGGAYVISQ